MYVHSLLADTVEGLKDIKAADGLKDIWRAAHATWCTTYGKTELHELQSDVPPTELKEFLSNEAVSNSDAFQLKDLVLIDQGRILCCWQSVPGSSSKRLIGMRVVAYFAPLQTAVLNLTVIMKDSRGQKNLDLMNKVTGDYIRRAIPQAQYIMLATSRHQQANYNTYTVTGFPWLRGNGEGYDYIKMIDIDIWEEEDFASSIGSDAAWDLWTEGKTRWQGKLLSNGKRSKTTGWRIPVSGGYGKDKHTLVAQLPLPTKMVTSNKSRNKRPRNDNSSNQDLGGEPILELVILEFVAWYPLMSYMLDLKHLMRADAIECGESKDIRFYQALARLADLAEERMAYLENVLRSYDPEADPGERALYAHEAERYGEEVRVASLSTPAMRERMAEFQRSREASILKQLAKGAAAQKLPSHKTQDAASEPAKWE